MTTTVLPAISGGGGGGGAMVIGDPVTGGTTGSVLFIGSGPVLSQSNSKFFWDNSNKNLGIGTATPQYALTLANTGYVDAFGSGRYGLAAFWDTTSTFSGVYLGYEVGTTKGLVVGSTAGGPSALGFITFNGASWSEILTITSASVGIGTLSPATLLHVAGTITGGDIFGGYGRFTNYTSTGTGEGLELGWHASNNASHITSYNRSSSTFLPMAVYASTYSLNGQSATVQMHMNGSGNFIFGNNSTSPLSKVHIEGQLTIVDGNQASGKILSCDSSGTASWITNPISGDVGGPGSSTNNNIAVFNGTTGKLIADSGVNLSALGDVVGPAGCTSGNLALFNSATGKSLGDSGIAPGSVVTGSGSSGTVALWSSGSVVTAGPTPCADGTVNPVTSVTTVNGIVTAIS